jgi:hypothetical protein
VALWKGSVRTTTVLNSATLSVTIRASDLSMAGTATVTARYGQAADSLSNGLSFTVLKTALGPTPTPDPTHQPTNGKFPRSALFAQTAGGVAPLHARRDHRATTTARTTN